MQINETQLYNQIFSPFGSTRTGWGNIADTMEVGFSSTPICNIAFEIFKEYKTTNPNIEECVNRIYLSLDQIKGRESQLQKNFQAAVLQNKEGLIKPLAGHLDLQKYRCTSDPQRSKDRVLQEANKTALSLLSSLEKVKSNPSASYKDLADVIIKSDACISMMRGEIRNYKTYMGSGQG